MIAETSFFQNLPIGRFKKGQLLIFQGEVPRHGFVLKQGIIKEYDISKQGNEQTTWLIGVLEIFPFPWLIGASTTASYYYETTSDCELYILERAIYQDMIKKNPIFLLNELERQAKKEINQTRRLAAVLNTRAKYKIANTFHYLIESYGKLLNDDLVEINISLTHQEIANLTGLTRETVSKELSLMKKKGLIVQQKNNSSYVIKLSIINELLSSPLSKLGFSE